MILRGKTFLVTGGTGLVGRSLVPALLGKGVRVVSLSRRKPTTAHRNLVWVPCDLRRVGVSHRRRVKKADCVVYLAAHIPLRSAGEETILDAKESTLDPFLRFLAFLGDLAPKIVFASTVDVYGHPSFSREIRESDPLQPFTSYAAAKLVSEEYLKFYCRILQRSYVILRFAQIYGPHEPKVRVIPFILEAALHRTIFHLFGSGKDRRKFLFTEDAAAAILNAANYRGSGIFNIAGPESASVKDVIRTIENLTGKKLRIREHPSNQRPIHVLPDITRARRELEFSPRFSLRAGLAQLLGVHIN